MPVHYAGGMGALSEVYSFARANGLRVIEDAAHAFGSIYQGKKIGSFGDIACFSFDGIKNITSGEGGCIVSEDKQLMQKVRDSRLLGVQKDTENRYLGSRSWDFDVLEQGWRYHMSNIMAAIGRVQLKKFYKFSEKRKELARYYDFKLKDQVLIKNLNLNYDEVVPHIYTVQIQGLKNRKILQKKLLDAGIQTGIHYLPNHLLSFYKNKQVTSLPLTEKIYSQILTLPLHPEVSHQDIDYITDALVKAVVEDFI
jgi:dTDP-4-amino-4,6-dideoxygalactose transaminase